MRSKIKNKVIASLMLTAFFVTNSMSAAFAMDSYIGYNAGSPAIRAAGMGSTVKPGRIPFRSTIKPILVFPAPAARVSAA